MTQIQQNITHLINESKKHESKKLKTININKLHIKQIEQLKHQQFNKEIQVTTINSKSSNNVELLHRRLNDAILLLADKQSGGISNYSDIKIILDDLIKGFGMTNGHNRTS
jgi:uncharacterized UPF0160 family protein